MTDTAATVWCDACGHRFPDAVAATAIPRPPCPECGATARRTEVLVQETVGVVVDDVRGIGYRESKTKWLVKFYNRREFFRLTGRWHQVQRTFDKRADRYVEHIRDAEAGEVIKDVDESLCGHQGHGSARAGNTKNAPPPASGASNGASA